MSKINKTIVTITGIRPDFIRMSNVFKKLDKNFNHILVHTGQHYDKMLSDVFFDELEIRKPDYVLETGKRSSTHYEQLSYLTIAIFKLFKDKNIEPDLIVFLGDSNTAAISLPLKKEGYKICHIEAGMRSYDKRMLEELNRTVCDHCSDLLFVYHDDYKTFLEKENIKKNVNVVGNTITELCLPLMEEYSKTDKKENRILMDIHRPENFKYRNRMENIIKYGNECVDRYGLPVYMLYFKRTGEYIKKYGLSLGKIKLIKLMSFKKYLKNVYHSKFIISDSGTGQEEPAIFKTKVIVPRDFTERPQSVENNCSYMLNVNDTEFEESFNWLDEDFNGDIKWLGDGTTSEQIINGIKKYFNV